MQDKMHEVQVKTIRKLIERDAQRYSELYKGFKEKDRFPYHLKQLLKYDYVRKDDNRYFITKEGMKISTEYRWHSFKLMKLPTPRYIFIIKHKNNYFFKKTFVNDPTRKAYYLLPGGAPETGETIAKTCKRLLKKKFGIEGEISYLGACHYTNYTTDGDVLFENICLVFNVVLSSDPEKTKQGQWLSKTEIKKITKTDPVHQLAKKYIINEYKQPLLEIEFIHDYGFTRDN